MLTRTHMHTRTHASWPPVVPAVKQEVDRNEDMLRSCLRAIDALAKLPNAMQVRGGAVAACACVTKLCTLHPALMACLRRAPCLVGLAGGPQPPVLRPAVLPCPRALLHEDLFCPAGPPCLPHHPSQVAPFKQFMENVVMGPPLRVSGPLCTSSRHRAAAHIGQASLRLDAILHPGRICSTPAACHPNQPCLCSALRFGCVLLHRNLPQEPP